MDKISKEQRSANMRKIKSKNMLPELEVRKKLFALGYRYRIHVKNLPGSPDIVFPLKKKAIFVHGCFWHQHIAKNCSKVHLPKSNKEYWLTKLEMTKRRDKAAVFQLKKMGWSVLVIWECQVKHEDKLAHTLIKFLS